MLAAAPAAAIEGLALQVGDLSGPAWQVRDLNFRFYWMGGDEAGLEVSASAAELPPPIGKTGKLAITCARARVTLSTVSCDNGRAHVASPGLDRPDFPVAFRYERSSGRLSVSFRKLAMAGGSLAGSAEMNGARWRVRVDAANLKAERLAALSKGIVSWPEGFTVSAGRLSFTADLSGDGPVVANLNLTGKTQALSFAAPGVAPAGEDLTTEWEVQGSRTKADWDFTVTAVLQRGDLLAVDPVVLTPATGPIQVQAMLNWEPQGQLLTVHRLVFDHPDAAKLEGRLEASLASTARLLSADLRLAEGNLAGLYPTYLQPLAVGTTFDDLDTSGQVQGEFRYRLETGLSVSTALNNVRFKDRGERFEIAGLNGELGWSADGPPVRSRLEWQSGALYRLALGPARAALETRGGTVQLLEPAEFQVLDGKLLVESFALKNPGTPSVEWSFDAVLTPLSMEDFSTAMGWPRMAGKLSGVIPVVTYANSRLSVGGVLLTRVFDGAVTVRNLALERPFGIAPALRADVELNNLDLDALTRTFSFGKIEGRLGGRIHDLQLVDWEPVAFDARFATPPDDRSRHRISQKAVETLTNLGGGGIGGALSRSYLRFFEQFYYDRIGLGCRLQDGVCVMDGIAPAKNGYYIVKGGGLPRIDVIGFVREVDWDELVQRLKRVTREQQPIIK